MNEEDKTKSREMFEQMLNCCCCSSCPCNSCVHKNVCKHADENPERCEDFKTEPNYKIHSHIDQLFQPIFKWVQFHYPAGGVCFYVDHDTAKMKIDHGPYIFDDIYKRAATGFNPATPESGEKEDANNG